MLRNAIGATRLIKNRATPKLNRWGTVGAPAVRRQLRGGWRLVRRLNSLLLPFLLFAGAGFGLAKQILASTEKSVISFVVALCVLPVVTSRIYVGVVAVMLIVATIVYPSGIPRPIEIGGNGFDVIELLILSLIVVVFVQSIANGKVELFSSPVTLPLLMFMGTIGVSLIVSSVDQSPTVGIRSTFQQVMNSGPRAAIDYLFFFPVAFGIRTEKQVRVVMRTVIWACVLVALVMIVQYFIGRGTVLAIGAPEYGVTFVKNGDDPESKSLVRSLPPGLSPMLAFLLFSLTYASYLGVKKSAAVSIGAAVMGIGIVFSFTRNFWITTFVGMLICAFLSPWQVRRRFLLFGVVLVFAIVALSLSLGQMASGGAGQKFAKALDDRFLSIFQKETLSSSSLQNRVRENRHAIEQIRRHPITGIGVGRPIEYRGVQTRTQGEIIVPNFTIHNSYMDLYLQNSVFCLLALAWLSIAFLLRCHQLIRRAKDPLWKSMGTAFFAGYIGTLMKATTGMVFQANHEMCTMSLMWGLVEAVHFLIDRGELQEEKSPCIREQAAGTRTPAL